MDDTLAKAIDLHRRGELVQAMALYRDLIDRAPDNADAWHLFGVAAHQQGARELALDLIEGAIRLNGDAADYHSNLGMVLKALGREDDAGAALERAIELDARHAKALANLAGIRRGQGRFEDAVALAERAVAAGPEDAETHNNLGNALKDLGRAEDAVTAYARAVDLAPDYALGHWNLSLALLLSGRLEEGFAEMAWRWRWSGFPAPRRDFAQPLWQGEALDGRCVLLHAEQGLGDAIQFLRYAPLVRARGGGVVIEVPQALVPLADPAGLADRVLAPGGDPGPFDCHAPFLDLPRIFATSLHTIPAEIPYLAPDPARRAHWQERLGAAPGLKVGLNWCGNPKIAVERFRRLPVDALAPLFAVPGVRFYSLQKGPGGPAQPALAESPIIETGEAPLTETAALMANLDLVITSDTAIAHLAGALGVPTWLALHNAPDWRWLLGRADSPWYPSLRLFRQASAGDWAGVIERLARELADRAAGA